MSEDKNGIKWKDIPFHLLHITNCPHYNYVIILNMHHALLTRGSSGMMAGRLLLLVFCLLLSMCCFLWLDGCLQLLASDLDVGD